MSTKVKTQLHELDRALGGGLPIATKKGCMILLSGPPGIGKTTLLMTIGLAITKQFERATLISSEQTPTNLAAMFPLKRTPRFLFVHETDGREILWLVKNTAAPIVFVDSAQAVTGITNARGRALKSAHARLMAFTKALREAAGETGTTIIVTCHESRDGVAPSVLHQYDIAARLSSHEGARRRLTITRNRFGRSFAAIDLTVTASGLYDA